MEKYSRSAWGLAARAALASLLVVGAAGTASAAAPPAAPGDAESQSGSSAAVPPAAPGEGAESESAARTPKFVVPDRSATDAVLPQDLEIGDFTSDGIPDVIVANVGPDAFNGGVSVLPGDGAGSLEAAIDTGVGANQGTQSVATGDFNEDGKLDVVVQTGTTGGPGPIRILLGTGTGTFTLGVELSGGNGHVVAGELTGDDHIDVAFAYENGAAIVKLYPGKGDGTFRPVVQLDSLWDANNFKLADLNGDGLLDLVGISGPVWAMINEGGGSFAAPVYTLCNELCLFEATLADFDGDGTLDIAGATGSEGTIEVASGDGDGTFTPVETIEDVAFATGYLTSGDFSGDGIPDLVVANEYAYESKIVILMKGRGDFTFGSWTYWTTGNEGPTPVDLNDDGLLDLVAWSGDPGMVYTTLNAGGGKFKAPQSRPSKTVGVPEPADINGDGRMDVVAAAIGSVESGAVLSITTYLGEGNGKFKRPVVSSITDESLEIFDRIGQIKLADVDEDGKIDLVAAYEHLYPKPISALVLFGNGKGKFRNLTKLGVGENWVSNPAIAVGDVNGDDRLDIVGQTNSQISTWLGNGDGTFDAAVMSGSSGSEHPGLVLADFTGDGKLDAGSIIDTGTSHTGAGQLKLNRGNGNGTFTHVQTISYDGSPAGPGLVADLNGDDRPDIALGASRGSHTGLSGIRVFLNGGGGAPFAAPAFYAAPPYGLGDLDAADLDLDGDLDLSSNGYSALPIALNDGTGVFTGPAQYILPNPSPARVAADFTGDGKPDLWNVNGTDRGLYSLYINKSRG